MPDVIKALFGIVAGPVLVALGLLALQFTLFVMGIDAGPVISLLVASTPIWLPFILASLAYYFWIEQVRMHFALRNGRTTLRIRLPQEVFKSPQAMETVLSQIHNVQSADNPWQGWIDGKHPLIFSFELVSFGGQIRFYANVPTRKTKDALEAQLYSQYPGVEVVEEMIDYTAEIPWDPERYEYMSFHMGKGGPQEFPIKTYIDCGLDRMPKEEEKIDPMAPMLEQLAATKPHERIWIQILCKPHAKKSFKAGYLREGKTWEGKVKTKIDELMGRNKGSTLGPAETDEMPRLTMGEKDTVSAMERNAGKYAYETAIRWMYITEAGKFNGDCINPILRSFSEYDILGRNKVGPLWRTDFDYNLFSDPTGKRKMAYKKDELKKYKQRSYQRRGDNDDPKIFTAEELATMFHLPGRTVVTPNIDRITSTRSEAPANLPTG